MGVDISYIAPHNPQANAKVECWHRTLKSMLHAYVNQNHTNWDKLLPILQFAINTAKNKMTSYTPHFLSFVRAPRLPAELADKPNYVLTLSEDEYLQEIQHNMAIIYELVRNHICEYHQTTCARVNKGVEKEGHLEVGDVMLRQEHKSAKGRNKKLFCAYGGTPHIVVKKQSLTTVQIQNIENGKTLPSAMNVKTLRRFYGREDTLPLQL